MKRLFSESEPEADLTHGVPGVQWHGDDQAPAAPPPLTGASSGFDETFESFGVYVGIIAAAALFLRLLVLGMGPATDLEAAYTPTTGTELRLAEGLANEFRYGLTEYPQNPRYAAMEALRAERGERVPMEGSELYADAYHAPGYPAVLAAFTKTGLDLRWLLLIQCVLAAGIPLVAYRITLVLLGQKKPALLVCGLTALHPALIIAPAALSGGVIAVALLALGLWALSSREDSEPLTAAGGGLSMGLASLFNPLLFWTAPLVAVWLVLSGRRLQSGVIAAAMLLGAVTPPALWMYRNASADLGATLTRAPDLERYMSVLGQLESPSLDRTRRDDAMLAQLADAAATADGENLFAQLESETRWRLREQGNAYLQLGNDRALRTLVGHSGAAAFTRLKLNYTPDGDTAAWLGETAPADATVETPGTAALASGWVMLNFLLLAATIAGIVALVWRRHIHEAGLLLGLGLAVLIGTITLPGETERLPVFLLQILLIGGMLSPKPIRAARTARKSGRSSGLSLQRLGTDPAPSAGGPGGPLPPLGGAPGHALGTQPAAQDTGHNAVHPMLRAHTSEADSSLSPPRRLV